MCIQNRILKPFRKLHEITLVSQLHFSIPTIVKSTKSFHHIDIFLTDTKQGQSIICVCTSPYLEERILDQNELDSYKTLHFHLLSNAKLKFSQFLTPKHPCFMEFHIEDQLTQFIFFFKSPAPH